MRFGLPRSPSLAHRLDRDTSGCLVLGRHRKALAALGKQFKNGEVGKTYWAVVEGAPEADEGVIDLPLGRLDVDARLVDEARSARPAGGEQVESDGTRSLAWARLARARTPDRADASASGALRRNGLADLGRQYLRQGAAPRHGGPVLHLHAREVVVPLYKNRDPIKVTAPVPEHMRERLAQCGWREEERETPLAPDAAAREPKSVISDQ